VRPRQIPFTQVDLVKTEVEAMLEMGVIERTSSPYNAPIVLVKKSDGKVRFCIDYRALNRISEFDGEPLPDIDLLFSRLGKARYFSKVDLSKGYWQIPVRESDKAKLAFSVPQGQFTFSVMPFGLQSAVAVFSRMMRKLLDPLQREDIVNFMDDCLIATETWEAHLEALEALFKRLREAGLTARPTKVFIGFKELDFLGHRVGHGLRWPEAAKLDKIKSAKRPETKREVRAFIGLLSFYRKYVPNFAALAVPLTNLTRKGAKNRVEWTEACEDAFTSLKDRLMKQPALCLPDFSLPFVVQTDASDFGLGAVLAQERDDDLQPVMFASRKLNDAETRYTTSEKECLGVVWAVRKFEVYLYGQRFILQTDHDCLQYLKASQQSNSRLMRWALFLANHNIQVKIIPGKENIAADYLSRYVHV